MKTHDTKDRAVMFGEAPLYMFTITTGSFIYHPLDIPNMNTVKILSQDVKDVL